MVIAAVIGLTMGIVAAIWRGSWVDTLGMFAALFGVSAPIFWLGLMLIFLFAFRLGWLPSTGTGGWKGIVLPAFALGLASAGLIARMTRSCLLEVMSQDYIRTARAKGLREWLVVYRHAMKNAMIPIVTIVGLQFGTMLSGAVVTEQVFSRPGIGLLMVTAILEKDFRLAQGTILLTAVSYLLVNLMVDVSYAWLDPRIHYE
jgi:ABC-type dipeptide/oligopeptide/nickel transport system permease component